MECVSEVAAPMIGPTRNPYNISGMFMSSDGNFVFEKNVDTIWPAFNPNPDDAMLGKKDITPEATLIDFISTSASYHGVKKQDLRGLEIDLLKVLPYNVMPANAAAWYMAKRKFYAQQPADKQLLPFLLRKYPTMFKVSKYGTVEFLEQYPKEAARRKLTYLVKFGLYAYFSHKIDEYGAYFFDPSYYERTEPFHEALKIAVGNYGEGTMRPCMAFFRKYRHKFDWDDHGYSHSITTRPGGDMVNKVTGIIVAPLKDEYGNTNHGYIKFGSGELAIFCVKSLYKDGVHYSGDIMKLPAVEFDGFKLPGTGTGIGAVDRCYATLVWCGRRPNKVYYSSLADLNVKDFKTNCQARAHQGKRLRQPSSSMMIGQVVEIRKNGAVVSVRNDSDDRVFIPGWSKENWQKNIRKLTTPNGECLGVRDLVSYYIDSKLAGIGFTAIGKDVMLLKEYEEEDTEHLRRKQTQKWKEQMSNKTRRNRRSVSMSAGADYDQSEEELRGLVTDSDSSSASCYEVSDSELAWLENGIEDMIDDLGSQNDPKIKIFQQVKKDLISCREQRKGKEVKTGRDSGIGYLSSRSTPEELFDPKKVEKGFWRTRAALVSLEEYRSSEDTDYKSGAEVEEYEPKPQRRKIRNRSRSSGFLARRNRTLSSDFEYVYGCRFRHMSEMSGKTESVITCSGFSSASGTGRPTYRQNNLPYWVKAVNLPEQFDPESGKFVPIDRWYDEYKDKDYKYPKSDVDEPSDEEEPDSKDSKEESDDEETKAKEFFHDPWSSDISDDEAIEEKIAKRESTWDSSIPFEEVQALLKERTEPLPEDIINGEHHKVLEAKSEVKVTLTPSKDDDKSDKEDIVIIDDDSSNNSKQRPTPKSGFYNWVINAVNKEGELSTDSEDSDEDPEYYPPAVFRRDRFDPEEYNVQDDYISDEEIKFINEGWQETLKESLIQSDKRNYVSIHIPVISVSQRKEHAMEGHRRIQHYNEGVARTAAREAAAAAAAAAAACATPVSGLASAMKGLNLSDCDLSKVLTRGKVTSPDKKIEEEKESSDNEQQQDKSIDDKAASDNQLSDKGSTSTDQNANDLCHEGSVVGPQ